MLTDLFSLVISLSNSAIARSRYAKYRSLRYSSFPRTNSKITSSRCFRLMGICANYAGGK